MPASSHAAVLSGGPAAPRRIINVKRLILLIAVAVLGISFVASKVPIARAQDVGDVNNATATYYGEDGKCYVETVAATGLDGDGAKWFIEAMNSTLTKIGHSAKFTFNNGTVTANATTDCPEPEAAPGPGAGKVIFEKWIKPALAVAGGLALVIACSLGITEVYQKISGNSVEQQSRLASSIMGVGGSLSTALLTFIVGGGDWQSTVASAVTAFFTTYLVDAYGFGNLQNMMKGWVATAFGFAVDLAVGGTSTIRTTIANLRADTQETLAQVRA